MYIRGYRDIKAITIDINRYKKKINFFSFIFNYF